MRQRALSRRAVLKGTAAGAVAAAVAGCAPPEAAPVDPAAPPDPETVLLTKVIADKEQIVALYRQAARPGTRLATTLQPFQHRHEAHLVELRRRLPPAPPPASPSPSVSAGSPPATARVSVGRLRELERRSAATRPRQIGGASPPLAQLLACIGACEAAHAAALARTP
ncbi:twin-arginine translocation signal domain-containing protein [Sphaerisporangium corydalis]|uniref:Twin-arginine translocation signal domain-containing protein n=1 Tax=Sphaerisporangium corydalis TaxID=1441875 RepID=A0ABV9E7F3_9ACTN|nr:twin-arginine translocation signal domain-containing protein [Sphaerisporangium corydalis]